MAKVTYYDLEKAASSVDFMGHTFDHKEPVEIDHTDPANDLLFAKLNTNPFFKVEGLPAADELAKEQEKRGPGRPRKVAIENSIKVEADRKAAIDKLRKERADAQAKAKSDAEHDAAEVKYRAEAALLKASQPTVADLNEPVVAPVAAKK